MKNIKSILLLALALPLGVYASRSDDNEAEMQSQIETSSTLVQSAIGLDPLIEEALDNNPEVALEEWLIKNRKEILWNILSFYDLEEALRTTTLLFFPYTNMFFSLGAEGAKYLIEGPEDEDVLLDKDVRLNGILALSVLFNSALLGFTLDTFSLSGHPSIMPDLPYMPSFRARLELTALFIAWNTSVRLWQEIRAREDYSSEEL